MSAATGIDTLVDELLGTLSPPLCDQYGNGGECSHGNLAKWALHFQPCGCLFLLCDEHAEDEREGQRWVEDHPEPRREGGTYCIGCVAHVPAVAVGRWTWTRL
ncbi:hypothetical protein [Microbacterium lacus]|uniref:hypothetical protein n=1 Tax=Microbacterium lacus TaxID=415217 RepID=UPI000C2C832D|nr:hypothetical protein [Microbacterium lacus]